ncbi:ribonuclease H-like domain-containing protein [Tanacetum coccineum]|uniref:Ribonuclease H-like domain-containing protein n=1 Tax=Tanacetum coccineum TaxID=301880 RepID=A0ABQ5BL62_9ASTR
MTQTVPSKSTAKVTYQGTARSRVPQAVLSRSTDGSYYPRMDNRRPRISSYSPSSRSSTTRTPHRPYRPKKIVKSIWVKKGSTVGSQAVLPQGNGIHKKISKTMLIIDSRISGSMTGDKDKLSDFKEFKGGYVAFGNDSKGGRISGKGTIKTSCLDFEKVSYVEELKFNLLSFVDEDLVILRAPRKNDVYSLDLKNIIPSGGVTCLVAKATNDEVVLWHRRLGHVNLKNINKLVQGNLVKGLPSKTFKIDHSCLACNKGKQHRASCKKVKERTIREPLELLHMDLFGPVSVESINKKNGTAWCVSRMQHNSHVFCLKKGIKREYSIARTPQQNGVAERKNRTLIEAARTMLADSLLPIQFWAEAVNTACYSKKATCWDILTSSKGFRVYNRVTRKVQECLHVNFLENQENQKGKGPDWMFDLDLLTPSMNYIPEPKRSLLKKQALADESWAEAMQEELLQFQLQEQSALFLAFASSWLHCQSEWMSRVQPYIGNITEEEYSNSSRFKILLHPNKVYRVVKHFIAASSPQEHDEEGEDVDVHLYRSMIGCLMYLTALRPDIMFAVCLCARFQVTPKVSHLHAVKRIFRYLKHQPKLGLWYPKDSPFHLEAFSDSDYAGDNHERKNTFRRMQLSWKKTGLLAMQINKQCGYLLLQEGRICTASKLLCSGTFGWQNQLLIYGF